MKKFIAISSAVLVAASVFVVCCGFNRICRLSGSSVRFTPADRASLAKSEEIALVYLSYWGPRCASRYKKPLDAELLARLWHRGPSRKMYDTKGDAYWAKARKEINSRK